MKRKVRFSSLSRANRRYLQNAAVVVVAIVCSAAAQAELTISNGNYQVETFAEYQQTSTGGRAKYITLDSSGNVYVTHDAANLMQVKSNGEASVLKSGFNNLQGVEWTGGSVFGDFVYSAEVYSNGIKKINSLGDTTTFATLPEQPLVLALDGTGNYGNKLYAATRSSTKIYSLDESGNVSPFVNLTGLTDGFPLDIAIDPTGRYNGSMFLSLTEVSNTSYQGILSIDPQGNISQYRSGGYWGMHLVFDSTPGAVFGGDLFISGGNGIKQLTPEGDLINLLQSDRLIQDYAFGDDGALYIMEVDSSTTTGGNVTISRITVIPEPASLLLLGLGAIATTFKRHKKKV